MTSAESHDTADFFAFFKVNLYRFTDLYMKTLKIWNVYVTSEQKISFFLIDEVM